MREIKEETGARQGSIARSAAIASTRRRPPDDVPDLLSPANGTTDVYVGDAAELAEVRWVSLVRGS